MTKYRVEARHRREQARSPEILSTPEDVDVLIDALLASPVDENLAQLHSLQRPLLPPGYPDHELLVGAKADLQVGVLAFMDHEGNVVTLGPAEARSNVVYCLGGEITEFPDRSEVPVGLIRRAVKEFLESGGLRPNCVEWQIPEFW